MLNQHLPLDRAKLAVSFVLSYFFWFCQMYTLNRVDISLHWKESVEVAWASDQDASWAPSSFPGTLNC